MLKPISPDAYVTYVSGQDSSIDWGCDPGKGDADTTTKTLEYYKETLTDPAKWRNLLKFKAGAEPTVFHVGVINGATLNRVEDDTSNADSYRIRQQYYECFLHGVRDIKGFYSKPTMKTINGVEYVDPEWLASNFVGHLRNVALEVGRIAWSWNQLDHTTIKN